MKIGPRRLSALGVLLLALVVGAPTAAAHSLAVETHATSAAATQSPAGTVRLMAVGDVMLGQSIGRRIKRNGLLAPWLKVKQYFDQADLVVANLECVISDRGVKWPKTFNFRAPIAAAASLAAAGVDAVTVANNHAIDYGFTAFGDTLRHLDAAGVGHFGGGANIKQARSPLIIANNGLRIAFLGYVLPFSGRPAFNTRQWAATSTTAGLAIGTPDIVSTDVRAAKQQADIVVVMVHGGIEYSFRPNTAQKNFGHAALAAGATLVIGAHPHVLQGYVFEQHQVIAYSTGNFVFDYFTGDPNDTAILDVTLNANGVDSIRWIPIEIHNGFPRPAVGDEITRIMSHLKRLPAP
jgi:poly-gamma-glutamate capsule biosynthesis protein CapA/YwtB (metallophosphatase superfamily)